MGLAILEATPKGRLFIGGRWLDSRSGLTIPTSNPATGEVLGHVPLADSSDLDRAVQAAHETLPAWAETHGPERGNRLRAHRREPSRPRFCSATK